MPDTFTGQYVSQTGALRAPLRGLLERVKEIPETHRPKNCNRFFLPPDENF